MNTAAAVEISDVTPLELTVGSGARFEALNGLSDVLNLACAAQIAFLLQERALNGDREDSWDMDLAVYAVRNVAEMAMRLNENHGAGG
jgi:hypothetical protein